jgi:hypothetical protein
MPKSVTEKLLIKAESAVWLSDTGQRDLLGPLPIGASYVKGPGKATVAVVFAPDAASLRATLDAHRAGLDGPAAFWVAYPKANRTDINRDSLWPILEEYGMRPISQVAIDDVWSALRFRMLREGEAPISGGARSGAGA